MPVSKPSREKAVLLSVSTADRSEEEVDRSLAELELLLASLHIRTVGRYLQRRAGGPTPTYLGEGRLAEVAAVTGGPGHLPRGPGSVEPPPQDSALIAVVDDELNPGVLRNLERALGVPVWDRTQVILQIFQARARSKEALLQVELARIAYELPRVRDDHALGDREGGGGRASRGASNVELAKRRLRDRAAGIRAELEALGPLLVRQPRQEPFKVVLVGYTNAGKSSLMRRLTGSEVLVKDQLFATLTTTARQLAPPAVPPIVLVDSVGFIDRLPHGLVAAFRSTLAEAQGAWLLLHVADASDPHVERQIQVTSETLAELGLAEAPSWLLLNKIDRVGDPRRAELLRAHPEAQLLSAFDDQLLAELRARIDGYFDALLEERSFELLYPQRAVLAQLGDQVRIVEEEYGETLRLKVRALPHVLERLRIRLET